jgi:type I restriction enzyme S subunit
MGGRGLPHGWQVVRVRDVVRQLPDRVKVTPDASYDLAGVRWYGEGVFHRETATGRELSASYLYPLVPGSFIYNRLFAWKAAFAVVPEEMAGLVASNEFPQFEAAPDRVDPHFLLLVFTRQRTIAQVEAASVGSAAVSRNRFKEEEFLAFELLLPPLAEQQAVVARWRELRAEAAAAEASATALESSIEGRLLSDLGITPPPAISAPKAFATTWAGARRWSVGTVADAALGRDRLPASRHAYVPLGDVAAVTYGIQKSPQNRPGAFPRPYLRVANVRKGFLDLSEIKLIEVAPQDMPAFRLEPGDVLFVEGNGSRAELGRVAVWRGEIEDCVHQNHLIKVRPDQARLLPDFAMLWFNTEIGRSHFFRAAKSSSGLGTINSNEVRGAPIPLPPVSEQAAIVAEIGQVRTAAEALRVGSRESVARMETEIEALVFGQREDVEA